MKYFWPIGFIGIGLATIVLILVVTSPQDEQPESRTRLASPSTGFASYHGGQLPKNLPLTLSPEQFASDPTTMACYRVAGSIREVLYQLPCMCFCDKTEGHSSLLDCFVGRHGEKCDTCQKEVAYAYDQLLRGTSVEQIREDIRAALFRDIDVGAVCMQFRPARMLGVRKGAH